VAEKARPTVSDSRDIGTESGEGGTSTNWKCSSGRDQKDVLRRVIASVVRKGYNAMAGEWGRRQGEKEKRNTRNSHKRENI